MSPLDDELRHALSDRAVRLQPTADPFPGIERRARTMRRNRLASVAAGVALLVGGGAVAVPALLDATGTSSREEGLVPATQGPTPPPLPSPSPAPARAGALDVTDPWAYRGRALPAGDLAAYAREWRVRQPGSTFAPLFGQLYEPTGQLEVVFVSTGTADGDLWGVMRSSEAGPEPVWVAPLAAGTTALAAALPGDEVARLLVVAAPGSQRLAYDDGLERDGDEETALAPLADAVGTTALDGDPALDRVRVLGSDGSVVHDELAPDLVAGPDVGASPDAPSRPSPPPPSSAPSATATPPAPTAVPPVAGPSAAPPANAVSWPLRGTLASGPDLDAARRAFARALGGSVADLSFDPLLATDFDGGLRLVAGQAWLPGGRAHPVSYAAGGGCAPTPFVGRAIPAETGVLAFALGCVPGSSTDIVMVVPQPQTGSVAYGAAGSEYREQSFLPGLEPVVEIARDPSPVRGVDRLRVLDGNGDLDDPVYEGPLDALLCGIKECG